MRTNRLMVLLALVTVTAAGCKKDDAPRRLTFLFTTDEHSHLFAVGPEGADWPLPDAAGDGSLVVGVARRATILEEQRASATRRGADVVVVSSGDFSQGTLAGVAFVPSAPDLALLRVLGYDVVAIGNHEFDLGPAALGAAIAGSAARGEAPPLVLTNVLFDGESPADDPLAAVHGLRGSGRPITRSRVVVTAGGLRVGFVSSMGFDAARAAFAATPVRFTLTATSDREAFLTAAAALIQDEIDDLRASEDLDAVVLLGHGGISADPARPGDDERLAALLSGVDLVLAGHTHLQGGPRLVTAADGAEVPVVAAAAYGQTVGRVELLLKDGRRPKLVPDETAFLPVDDRVVPTTSPVVRGALSAVIAGIEAQFLPGTLTVVEGAAVQDDPATVGDLYFRSLGHTTFRVPGLRQPGETNGLNLSTDALRAVASALAGDTEIGLQVSGAVRGDLYPGDVSIADVYRMAPLGADPTTGTPGYPVIRAFISTAELRAALEGTLAMSLLSSADFYLSPSGLRVVYDPTLAPFDPVDPLGGGWITTLALVASDGTETVLYDAAATVAGLPPGWTSNPAALRSIATTYQVGAFAQAFGVTLRDAAGAPVTLEGAILAWPGSTATVKDHQALGRYVKGACAGNGGELPSVYDESTAEGIVPRRILCDGVACP